MESWVWLIDVIRDESLHHLQVLHVNPSEIKGSTRLRVFVQPALDRAEDMGSRPKHHGHPLVEGGGGEAWDRWGEILNAVHGLYNGIQVSIPLSNRRPSIRAKAEGVCNSVYLPRDGAGVERTYPVTCPGAMRVGLGGQGTDL
jgi:hypothetical protein